MKKILVALMLLALPTYAQVYTQTYSQSGAPTVNGFLVTGPTDAVTISLFGAQWATVQYSVTGTAGTATVTAEVSIDGTNWAPAPYSKQLNLVSANQTISPISGVALSTGDVWETPLPANAMKFRLRCAVTGTSTAVQIRGGTPYVPGMPVAAVLYDVTEGSIGAGVAAYTQDTSGWNSVIAMAGSPTTVVWSVRQLDDAGLNISGVAATFTSAAGGAATFTRYGGNTTSATVGASAQTVFANLTRRMAWSLPAGGTVTQGRMRVEAAR